MTDFDKRAGSSAWLPTMKELNSYPKCCLPRGQFGAGLYTTTGVNFQIAIKQQNTEPYYAHSGCACRGALPDINQDLQSFGIATILPADSDCISLENLKRAFFRITKERIINDLAAIDSLIEHLQKEGKLSGAGEGEITFLGDNINTDDSVDQFLKNLVEAIKTNQTSTKTQSKQYSFKLYCNKCRSDCYASTYKQDNKAKEWLCWNCHEYLATILDKQEVGIRTVDD